MTDIVSIDTNIRPTTARKTRRLLAAILIMSAVSVPLQWPAWSVTPLYAISSLLASVSLAAVGAVIWPHARMRPLALACLAGGFLWSFQWLSTWNASVFPVIGYFANVYLWVVCAAGFILTPRRSNISRADRMLIFGFFAAGPLQFLVVLTSLPEWNGFAPDVWWPHPFANRATYGAVLVVISAFWAFLAVAMTWVGLQRLRSMKRMDQALALPVVVCYCAVGLVASFSCVFNPFPPPTQNAFYFAMSLVMFFIPIGLVIAASARTVRRFTLAAQLSKRLAKQVLTGDVVRNEFRKLLGDDSLELYYWSEPSRCYVDTDGHRADVDLDGRQGVTAYLTNAQSEPMAVVVGDAMLVDHVSMLDSFFAASAIAIENVQLQASVKAQLEQVRASRARIVEATLEERRRIERDLHDGVQQRLLALQLKVATFRGSGIDATRILLDELSTELSDTLRSLRELAHGIHPTELRQFGLRGAIEVVAERFPLEIDLQVADERFSALVESTLYFVTCEALANVVKHAEATRVTVSIDRVDDHVFLKVEDNGKGGAVIRPGHGLDGLSERLRSVGGSMALAPATHDGCSLTSKLPIKAGEGG